MLFKKIINKLILEDTHYNKQMMNFNFTHSPWRKDFPAFQTFAEQSLVWLDSAATAQKPEPVIAALADYYRHGAANVHRAQHILGEKVTAVFEAVRHKVACYIEAGSADEIIFTRSTTEAINLVAYSLEARLPSKGKLVVSALEHHANLLPWQQLAKRKGLELCILPITETGIIDIVQAEQLIDGQTQLLAISQMSNVFGTIQPVQQLIKLAKAHGAVTLVDGAQGVVHQTVNVKSLDCDFYVFSGHKLYAPEGIGVLYGKAEMLKKLQPWQFGGEMVAEASYQTANFRQAPLGFEAGTPAIGAVIGLGAALDYLCSQDQQAIARYEAMLFKDLLKGLTDRPNVCLLGKPQQALASFYVKGIHPADLGQLLTEQSIAVRTGQHCCMPLYQQLGLKGATRVSLAFYNNLEDIKQFLNALDKAIELLQ